MSEAAQSEPAPELPEGTTLYQLSVKTRRVITTAPLKKVQTIEDEWVIGNLPGVNPMHVRDLYWRNCTHKKPALLGRAGMPIAIGRIRNKGEIIVRIAPPENA